MIASPQQRALPFLISEDVRRWRSVNQEGPHPESNHAGALHLRLLASRTWEPFVCGSSPVRSDLLTETKTERDGWIRWLLWLQASWAGLYLQNTFDFMLSVYFICSLYWILNTTRKLYGCAHLHTQTEIVKEAEVARVSGFITLIPENKQAKTCRSRKIFSYN